MAESHSPVKNVLTLTKRKRTRASHPKQLRINLNEPNERARAGKNGDQNEFYERKKMQKKVTEKSSDLLYTLWQTKKKDREGERKE